MKVVSCRRSVVITVIADGLCEGIIQPVFQVFEHSKIMHYYHYFFWPLLEYFNERKTVIPPLIEPTTSTVTTITTPTTTTLKAVISTTTEILSVRTEETETEGK